MDGRIDVSTLLFLVLAVVIFLKLRSVLGRRTGHEQTRFERYKAQQEASQRNGKLAGQDKVVTCRGASARRSSRAPARGAAGARRRRGAGQGAWPPATPASPRASSTSSAPMRPSIPIPSCKGARAAYEIIVTAFAEGNRKTLKGLLSREVYDGFAGAIADRESRGEQVDQSFVGIKSADIVEAELKNGMAQVTVKFVSELISATRDRAGEVIAAIPSASRRSPTSGRLRARSTRAIRTGS